MTGEKREKVSTTVSTLIFFPVAQLVMNEIHRPGLVGLRRQFSITPKFRLDPALGHFVSQLKAQLNLDPMRLLVVDLPADTAQQHMHAAIAVTHARRANLLNPSFKAGLIGATGFVMVARGVEFQKPTGSPDRHVPLHCKPRSPACTCDQASELSANDILKHFTVKGQVNRGRGTGYERTQSVEGAQRSGPPPSRSLMAWLVDSGDAKFVIRGWPASLADCARSALDFMSPAARMPIACVTPR
jgi:hypothetical protein